MIMKSINLKEQAEELVFGPSGKWWVGKLNLCARTRAFPKKITLIDETIREGEDTPDVHFSDDDKLRIISKLKEVGVREIEIGYVGAIDEHFEFAKKLTKEGTEMKIASHNRTYTKDSEWKVEIDRTIDAGVDMINLVGWASECMVATTPWLSKKAIPERIGKCIEYAKNRGVSTSFLLTDPVRTKLNVLANCFNSASNAGVDRVYVCDATGAATPEAINFLVKFARSIVGSKPEIALHLHDDMGLAMANTLEGVMAGAEVVDVTVNGLGHNCGITPLEEIATTLKVLYDTETGIGLEKLYDLSGEIEKISGMSVSPNKSIVGRNVYRHQLDSHVAGIIRGVWYAWDNVRPDALGRKLSLEWAAGRLRRGKSGSVMAKIEKMNLKVTDDQFEEISNRIREMVTKERILTEEEVEKIIRDSLQ